MDQAGTDALAIQTRDEEGTTMTMKDTVADATTVIGVVIDMVIVMTETTATTTALNIAVTAATIAVGMMSVVGTDAEMIVTPDMIVGTTGLTVVTAAEDALPAPLINMI